MLTATLLLALAQGPDVAIIVLDDAAPADVASVNTPVLDAFAAQSVVFVNGYGHPWCSPARDSLMRGAVRPVYRGVICPDQPPAADPVVPWTGSEPLMGCMFQALGYRTVNVGKWHLSRAPGNPDPLTAPIGLGFDRWMDGVPSGGGCFRGSKVTDGVLEPQGSSGWRARDQAEAFLEGLADARAEGKAFFGVLSFTDPHAPHRVSFSDPTPPPANSTERQRFESQIRGIDAELEDVLEALGPNALIFLVADNGTPQAVAPDPAKAKLSVYGRGVRVPFIVRGPGVVPGPVSAPVALYDILPTLADGYGIGHAHLEGESFLGWLVPYAAPGPRAHVYVENPTQGTHAIIEERWKLIEEADGTRLLFDLQSDPEESAPLPPTGVEYDRLAAILAGIP